MAGPCEVLMDTLDQQLAKQVLRIAQQEALRIERKFSRYRMDNIIHTINHSAGKPVAVDTETADLLDYADCCFQLSNGLFDITSGVLRQVWHFDGSNNVPDTRQVNALRQKLGWQKVRWQRPWLSLRPGMEVDFGGIAKEYAVDKTVQLINDNVNVNCLVNFGGDIAVTGSRSHGLPWVIGVENPNQQTPLSLQAPGIKLQSGAIATSGDSRRYLLKDGIRYSHVLNPKTGWPVSNGPRSITVAANSCTEAGMLSTMALLQGKDAEKFLNDQTLNYWCEW
ncbi:MAG: FAD:protein FMN transferase [Gammaproteobacteria bacterium]|nr:FAD:protein FMN transferase [Gammaproteobacteria bacterium]